MPVVALPFGVIYASRRRNPPGDFRPAAAPAGFPAPPRQSCTIARMTRPDDSLPAAADRLSRDATGPLPGSRKAYDAGSRPDLRVGRREVEQTPSGAAFEQLRAGAREAAQALGLSGAALFRRIYLPLLRPGLLTAALLVLVDVMKEMPATLLLRPLGWDTLAVRVYGLTAEGLWERAALPAVALVAAGLLPVALLNARRPERRGRRHGAA